MNASIIEEEFEPNIWETPADWPIDLPGYVFLARAFNEIGRAKFGGEWDKEAPPNPDDCNIADDDSAEGLSAWQRTQDLWEKESAQFRAASAKMHFEVQREITENCLLGHLHVALRPLQGGVMTPVESNIWNTENLKRRFELCKMSLSRPYATDHLTHWIYLTRPSLDAYLFAHASGVVSVESHVHQSPYLKLMVAISKELKISPDHQPKKESLIATLRARWTGAMPLSDNLAKAMATLLREPESQKGSASKSRRKK